MKIITKKMFLKETNDAVLALSESIADEIARMYYIGHVTKEKIRFWFQSDLRNRIMNNNSGWLFVEYPEHDHTSSPKVIKVTCCDIQTVLFLDATAFGNSWIEDRPDRQAWKSVTKELPPLPYEGDSEEYELHGRGVYAKQYIVYIAGAEESTSAYYTEDGEWRDLRATDEVLDVCFWMPMPLKPDGMKAIEQ